MSRVRIVCAYDGQGVAQELGRVLAAEDYVVEINHGRLAQAALTAERDPSEAVVLIWSPGAAGATYSLHWRQKVAPAHLIEIAICEPWPAYPRRWPVIDFTTWNGRRGSAAWRALSERLRTITRANAPERPAPWRSAVALGAASAMAVACAVIVRVNDTANDVAVAEGDTAIESAAMIGQGGPLSAIEPNGADDYDFAPGPLAPRYSTLTPAAAPPLLQSPELAPSFEARQAGLFGRIADMAEPLLDRISGDPTPPEQGP